LQSKEQKARLRIAIVGLGPAGSYLAALLSGKHEVEVFEGQAKERFTSTCAWGTGHGGIKPLLSEVGLKFEDYVYHRGKSLYVNAHDKITVMRAPHLSTFNKPQLIRDLPNGSEVRYGTYVRQGDLESRFDLVVDATGPYRRVLGKVDNGNDLVLPTVQYLVRYENRPFDDFYVEPFSSYTGYLWYFPLEDGLAYVGAGDVAKHHEARTLAFLKKYRPDEVIKKMGKPIRVASPGAVAPFRRGNVVGVGEAIGTVFPILGEGILPSMICAKLLADNLHDLKRYEEEVKARFRVYDDAYYFIRKKMSHAATFFNTLVPMIRIYTFFRRHQELTGVDPGLKETLEVLRPFGGSR
jgi:flavin-dependent dehydrogenase